MSSVNMKDYKNMMDDVNIPEETLNKLLQIPMMNFDKETIDNGENNVRVDNVKTNVVDFSRERENNNEFWMNLSGGKARKRKIYRNVAACFAIVLLGGAVFASARLFGSEKKNIITNNIEKSFDQLFGNSNTRLVNTTKKLEKSDVTFLGISDKECMEKCGFEGDFENDRTYSIISIKDAEGKELSIDDANKYALIPVVKNIYLSSMEDFSNKAIKNVNDGVIYFICDNYKLNILNEDQITLDVLDKEDINKPVRKYTDSKESKDEGVRSKDVLFDIPMKKIESEIGEDLVYEYDGPIRDDSKIYYDIAQKSVNTQSQNSENSSFIDSGNFDNKLYVLNHDKENGQYYFHFEFYSLEGEKIDKTIKVKSIVEKEDLQYDIRSYSTDKYLIICYYSKETDNVGYVVFDKNYKEVERKLIHLEREKRSNNYINYLYEPQTKRLIEVNIFCKEKKQHLMVTSYSVDGDENKNEIFIDELGEYAGNPEEMTKGYGVMYLSKSSRIVTLSYNTGIDGGKEYKGVINVENHDSAFHKAN